MFILLSGIPPFNGKDDEAILRAVKRGKFEFRQDKWKSVSTEAKDLISKMLVLEPEDRISATKALDHEWIKKYDNGEIDDTKLNKALSGLKKHKSDQKMQQAALSYMVMHMATKEDTKELDEAFKMLDTNHDGKLSLEELLEGVKEVFPEMTKEEATKMFKKADTDGSGHIDYTEWISATINKKKLLSDNNLKAAFDTFDVDKSGTISIDEIKKILGHGKKINEKVWKKILADVDSNKDGNIDYKEFKSMMDKFIQ